MTDDPPAHPPTDAGTRRLDATRTVGERNADDVAALLAFVGQRDVPCPVCRYNLRGLTTPICPECEQPLSLTVGAHEVRFGWLLVALVPSMFSGIAAMFLAIPIILSLLRPGMGTPSVQALGMDAFGLTSGMVGVLLALRRHRFLRLPINAQRLIALGTWAVHVGAFLIVLWVAFA